jgi:hypothetical protein
MSFLFLGYYLLFQVKRLNKLRIMSRYSKTMNQRCFKSNGLPKDENSKLKKKEEKEKRI